MARGIAVGVACTLFALPLAASAADDTKKEAHRTSKLGTCSKEAHAKGLKGDDRKKYMSTCLGSAKQAKASSGAAQPAS